MHHNNFYDNALGFTTDVFTAAGHPGFPQQGDLIENNDFFSNNFNPYLADSDVVPTVPVPVGTGMWIATETTTSSGTTASATTGGAGSCSSPSRTRSSAPTSP